ncbi:hypothetical protein OJAV_G00084010 [Oryzias javanicus]|uniref:Uncharacterized protein n=1 Tax=Oryzias javanicus TaxID=123683 RepID=A0A3S2UFZ2_ORYJA|nr:hypothetical protein OJAV_G00084010 [Oryzias javanicus]
MRPVTQLCWVARKSRDSCLSAAQRPRPHSVKLPVGAQLSVCADPRNRTSDGPAEPDLRQNRITKETNEKK